MAIVTISRQVGSLGDEIAASLAQDLTYKLVSHEDFSRLAANYDPNFEEQLARFEQEQGPGFFERLFFSTPVYLSLYQALVFELASQRQIIILGRGAQIVLRDIRQVYRLRVVAPLEIRVRRVCQTEGLTEDNALEFVKKYDHRRRALIKQIFDQDPSDWSLYDMILNTARLDVAAGVAIVKAAVEEVKRQQPMTEAVKVLQAKALSKRIEARIRDAFPGRNIEVSGESDGPITLSGALPSTEDRKRAEKLAKAMAGGLQVVNNLRTSVFAYGH